MKEVLTRDEMKTRFQDEWLLGTYGQIVVPVRAGGLCYHSRGIYSTDASRNSLILESPLIADPEVDEQFEILRGNVVCHSKERDEVDRAAMQLRLKASATLYTGEFPDDVIYLL